ncbi:MAG: glycosyltransferase, partial [Thermoanaerobaculia bacterium]
HGSGEPRLSLEDRSLYEAVSRENADALRDMLQGDDLLVIHDPQPLGTGALLKQELGLPSIWRCHIGLHEILPATREAWRFLKPYATVYDHAVFSVPNYIPSYLDGRASVIHPAIDPLSPKNRELSPHELTGILCNASLAIEHAPVLTPPCARPAKRLQGDGRWVSASEHGEIGLLYRPIVAQISRWDRLKGFVPLLEAFVILKSRRDGDLPSQHRRRLEIVRLVLAGPDPSSVADDPEALEVLEELSQRYCEMAPELQQDVALLTLPMASPKENALMVNAIQRCATVVVQNSLQEAFGLTVTEAMWKRTAVVASSACGLRHQIRDRIDGRLVSDPEDPEELASVLDEVLADPAGRETLARSAQRRVHHDFLIFSQLGAWLATFEDALRQAAAS